MLTIENKIEKGDKLPAAIKAGQPGSIAIGDSRCKALGCAIIVTLTNSKPITKAKDE